MDQSNFHPELENIQREFQQRLRTQEGELTPEREKEVLKQVIAEKFQATPKTQTQNDDEENKKPASIGKTEPSPDPKVQYQPLVDILITTAFEKGLTEAVKQVRKMSNAFLLDAFHDELVDKFYTEIKSREDA